MVKIYVRKIENGEMTLADVPIADSILRLRKVIEEMKVIEDMKSENEASENNTMMEITEN